MKIMMEPTLGYKARFTKTFNTADIDAFAAITGDDNPVHINEAFAQASIFGRRVVHGMLVASMFSKIFGTIYPGVGTAYLYQDLRFHEPVFPGEAITAEVELTELLGRNRFGVFKTVATNEAGKVVIEGTAKVRFP
jgi:acyl dehydratase